MTKKKHTSKKLFSEKEKGKFQNVSPDHEQRKIIKKGKQFYIFSIRNAFDIPII